MYKNNKSKIKMATYKDILYKKEDNETWSEWAKRVPDNDEDKLDYIGETIYVKIYDDDKENALEITDIFLQLGVEDLIPLLENEELLDAKIEEYYKKVLCPDNLESFKKTDASLEDDEEDDYVCPNKTITVADMIKALSRWIDFCIEEEP